MSDVDAPSGPEPARIAGGKGRSMPAEAPTKAKQETWRDWAPDAPEPSALLTRQELLDRLAREGFPTTGNQLRYWQTAGLVPYPVRRRQGQAVYAYYPPWMVEIVRALLDLRAHGDKLPQIRATLRGLAPAVANGSSWAGIMVVTVPDFIAERLAAFAEEIQARLPYRRFTHVELRLSDESGQGPLVWATPLPPNETDRVSPPPVAAGEGSVSRQAS